MMLTMIPMHYNEEDAHEHEVDVVDAALTDDSDGDYSIGDISSR